MVIGRVVGNVMIDCTSIHHRKYQPTSLATETWCCLEWPRRRGWCKQEQISGTHKVLTVLVQNPCSEKSAWIVGHHRRGVCSQKSYIDYRCVFKAKIQHFRKKCFSVPFIHLPGNTKNDALEMYPLPNMTIYFCWYPSLDFFGGVLFKELGVWR